MKVWVLTSSYNDYDRHGDYFEGVFSEKPSAADLVLNYKLPADVAEFVVSTGGGRQNVEYTWYYLTEHEC